MKAETIAKFIQALGVNNAVHTGGQWVQSSCPLAPFTHKGGKDSRPSFGVTVEPGGGSKFNCFTCLKGSLEALVGTLEMYVQQKPEYASLYDFKLARAYLDGDELQVQALEAYQEFQPSAYAEFQEWPQWYLESFPRWHTSQIAVEYLQKVRGIPADVADHFDLRYDAHNDRIVCPYKNAWGKLAGARGRTIGAYGPPHFDYAWNKIRNTRLVWYNEQALQEDRPVIVVEGQMDAMRIWPIYSTVVANMGSKITWEKMKKLEMAHSVLFMLDNDGTGKQHTPEYVDHLHSKGVQTGVIEYPEEYKDPDKVPKLILQDILSELV